jgi:hypothetical protein
VLAFFSLVPLILLANWLVVLAATAIALKVGRRNPTASRWILAFVLVPSILWWIVFHSFAGVTKEMAFDMEWSYGGPSRGYTARQHIVLRFKSHPNHFVGIFSEDLGGYLETLPSRDVTVVFDVTTDFGRTRGFHQTQVGDRRSWSHLGGYAGSRGDSDPSPWP